MSQSLNNNKRIAKNTLFLYFRMIVILVVSLYTSRVVLNVLGVEDYGTYNVVGGIIVILGFLNNAMAGATQRFLNVELGRNDFQQLQKVFCTSLVIHVLVAVTILIVAETIGLWYLNNYMNIASERMSAANWVYQFSVATFMVNILSVPYNATIVAHEKMSAFAYLSILEAILKLVIVYLLVLTTWDKLIIYAFLIFVVGVVLRLLYGIYCKRHFEECKIHKLDIDKAMMKEMLSFSSWTILGNLGYIGHTQGIALAINYFFGVTVNAAIGIANQVNGVVKNFVGNFLVALNPQIVKTYAAGQYTELHQLLIRGCQLAFYMVAFFVVPIAIEAASILQIWLKIVPDYTVTFVRIVLLITLFDSYSNILATAKGATGNIKIYQITLTTIGLFHVPLAIMFFYLGCPPQYAMYIYLCIVILLQIIRIKLVCNAIGLSLLRFYREVVGRSLQVFLLAMILPILIHIYAPATLLFSVLNSCLGCLSVLVISFLFGLNRKDKDKVVLMLKSKFFK